MLEGDGEATRDDGGEVEGECNSEGRAEFASERVPERDRSMEGDVESADEEAVVKGIANGCFRSSVTFIANVGSFFVSTGDERGFSSSCANPNTPPKSDSSRSLSHDLRSYPVPTQSRRTSRFHLSGWHREYDVMSG